MILFLFSEVTWYDRRNDEVENKYDKKNFDILR